MAKCTYKKKYVCCVQYHDSKGINYAKSHDLFMNFVLALAQEAKRYLVRHHRVRGAWNYSTGGAPPFPLESAPVVSSGSATLPVIR